MVAELFVYLPGRGKDISNDSGLPRWRVCESVQSSRIIRHPPSPMGDVGPRGELGLIVPGKTSLIIPQRRGIIRAIRTAWFTKPVRQRQTNRDKMKGTTEL